MMIRPLQPADLPAVTDIYNEVVIHSTAVFRDAPATVQERTEWWTSQREKGYPVMVAEEGGEILGFATFGDFRPWPGYRFTVEGTIHLRPDSRRKGIGSTLLKELISAARSLGKHMLIAGVDSDNTASLGLLAKMGFEQTAHMREVGFKFGRYLDLILLQYRLS
jgi:phosphinothricin acetyltransferase